MSIALIAESFLSRAATLAVELLRSVDDKRVEEVQDDRFADPSPLLTIICPDCGKGIAYKNRCPKCGGASWVVAGNQSNWYQTVTYPNWRRLLDEVADSPAEAVN